MKNGNAMKIALDTNVLIYFFEGIEPQAGKIEKILTAIMRDKNEGIISTITVAEILTGFYMAQDKIKVAKGDRSQVETTVATMRKQMFNAIAGKRKK